MKAETKEVTLYIQATKWSWDNKFEVKVNTFKCKSDSDRVVIDLNSVVVNVETPELDEKMLTLGEIEQIRDQIKAEKAASYLRITKMEDHINSLMCLENKVEE